MFCGLDESVVIWQTRSTLKAANQTCERLLKILPKVSTLSYGATFPNIYILKEPTYTDAGWREISTTKKTV